MQLCDGVAAGLLMSSEASVALLSGTDGHDLLLSQLSTLVLSTSLLLLLLLFLLWRQGPRWLSHSCSGATYEGKSLCAVSLYHQQGVLQLLHLHRALEKDSIASF